jgi:solute carrier family 10 (sodium/bile acid cotransporter), member 7
MKGFLLRNWFVLSLPAIVALAFAVPELGATNGWLQTQITTKVGVALIFLFQGLTIPTSALRKGLGNWKVHLLVQGFIFGLYPLLGMGFDRLFGARLTPDLRTGFLYLCVLPSTISTSPVLTAIAGGNTVAAIFNAVLSNLLGLALTPAWAAWLMRANSQSRPLGPVILEVAMLLFVPFIAGQILRNWVAEGADKHRKKFSNGSSAMILFIVFAAFSNSVKARVWIVHGWTATLWALGGAATLFTVASLLAELLGVWFRLNEGDRVVAVFGGPHKSLASGVPMAKVVFGAHPGLGLILLPLMFYHPLQLIVCGIVAERMAKRRRAHEPAAGVQHAPSKPR